MLFTTAGKGDSFKCRPFGLLFRNLIFGGKKLDRELFKIKAAMLGYAQQPSKQPPDSEEEKPSQEGKPTKIAEIISITKRHLDLAVQER